MSKLPGVPDIFRPELAPQLRYQAWSREVNKQYWLQLSSQKKLLPLSNEELARVRELTGDPDYGKGQ